MANKKHYFVGQRRTADGKLYAFTLEATKAANLADPSLRALNVFDSKKEAAFYRDFWNECFKKNGTYAW